VRTFGLLTEDGDIAMEPNELMDDCDSNEYMDCDDLEAESERLYPVESLPFLPPGKIPKTLPKTVSSKTRTTYQKARVFLVEATVELETLQHSLQMLAKQEAKEREEERISVYREIPSPSKESTKKARAKKHRLRNFLPKQAATKSRNSSSRPIIKPFADKPTCQKKKKTSPPKMSKEVKAGIKPQGQVEPFGAKGRYLNSAVRSNYSRVATGTENEHSDACLDPVLLAMSGSSFAASDNPRALKRTPTILDIDTTHDMPDYDDTEDDAESSSSSESEEEEDVPLIELLADHEAMEGEGDHLGCEECEDIAAGFTEEQESDVYDIPCVGLVDISCHPESEWYCQPAHDWYSTYGELEADQEQEQESSVSPPSSDPENILMLLTGYTPSSVSDLLKACDAKV
jgi:hypothetical protein